MTEKIPDIFYDPRSGGLRTIQVSEDELDTRILDRCENTVWYSGFISRDCFPESADVSYLRGATGRETQVTTRGIAPIGTFDVI